MSSSSKCIRRFDHNKGDQTSVNQAIQFGFSGKGAFLKALPSEVQLAMLS